MIERIPRPKAPFDSIAEAYSRMAPQRPLNRLAVYPTMYEAIGHVRDKRVLDLACGSGTITRDMARRGAAIVVGVDESSRMIRIAKSDRDRTLRQIKYKQGKVGSLGSIGEFDVVSGGFLLHYAKSKDELLRMCLDIHDNLIPGGRFVGITNNPDRIERQTSGKSERYGNQIEAELPLHEGSALKNIVTTETGEIIFTTYYWKKQTYEQALTAAGLTSIEWIVPSPTTEGIQEMGAEYWEEFAREPFMLILRAQKPEVAPTLHR